MDWAAPQLRRFEYTFPDLPDVPSAEPPPAHPPAAAASSAERWFDVVCYGASSESLLRLTRTSHPLYDSRCFTGLQTYSGAEVLSRMLLRQPQVLQRGRTVLEVGCGIGLLGAVLARCMRQPSPLSKDGAPPPTLPQPLLVLTDGEEDAVRLTLCNVACSLFSEQPAEEATVLRQLRSPLAHSPQLVAHTAWPPSRALSFAADSVSVHALQARWDACGVSAVSTYCERALQRPAGRFDVICGTDLLYGRTAIDDILDFAVPLLADTGVLLLAHTPRIAQLHSLIRTACQRRALTAGYVRHSAFVSDAEERDRGWAHVEVLVCATNKGWDALQQSADWRWVEVDDVGRVERELAEEENQCSDDGRLVLDSIGGYADDL